MSKPLAAELSVLAASPEFWDQARALKAILRHVMSFSGWVTGCACHDQKLQWKDGHAPPPIKCPWKGCRAPQLAKQLRFVQDAIAADRGSLTQAGFVSVKLDLVHSAMSRVIARLELKLHWVHELSYLVWQADEAAVAQEMLAKYDTASRDVSRAIGIHRVSGYFCGHEKGSIRLDMERHAAGHGMSKTLASEILAYQLYIIDDTAQEAPHRDVSQCHTWSSRAPKASLAGGLLLSAWESTWSSMVNWTTVRRRTCAGICSPGSLFCRRILHCPGS